MSPTSPARRAAKKGFTLVEILIVVIILGILAAIVIPQFTSASQNARTNSLETQLKTLKTQVQLFELEHGGVKPKLSSNWDDFTQRTNAAGNVETDGDFGPYMAVAPSNPLHDGDDKTTIGTDEGGSTAWLWDETTGTIKARRRNAAGTGWVYE